MESDKQTVEDAVKEIMQFAQIVGGQLVPGRRHQPGLQPESVCQSVLKDVLARGMPEMPDDSQRRAYLFRAVKNKYISRLRKRDHQHYADTVAELQAVDEHARPSLAADLSEQFGRDVVGLERLTQVLDSACHTDIDRAMVSRFVLADDRWSVVAAQFDKSPGALKVKFHRLREALLLAVAEPIKAGLAGVDRDVCEHILCRRQHPSDVERELGLPSEAVRAAFTTSVLPQITRVYGSVGAEVVRRLVGKLSSSQPADGGAPA